MFKQFIDDIISISRGEKLTNSTKEKLASTFQEGGQELIFREIPTHEPAGSSCVEFLYVNHRTDDCAPGGFVTTDYIKLTIAWLEDITNTWKETLDICPKIKA